MVYLCTIIKQQIKIIMKKSHGLLAALAGAMMGAGQAPIIQLKADYGNPYFSPKKHTVESYRSQQRKAKQRRKSR